MNLRRAIAAALAAGVLAAVAACGSGSPPLQTAFERVARIVKPRIVEISSPDSIGSGVVFDSKSDIVTNAHVVGTATKFQVTQTAGTAPLPARLVAVSAAHDLAVIRVISGADRLKPVTWADSAKAQVGEWVLAMGTPYGLADTVTQGIGFAIPSNTVASVARQLIADAPGHSEGGGATGR